MRINLTFVSALKYLEEWRTLISNLKKKNHSNYSKCTKNTLKIISHHQMNG